MVVSSFWPLWLEVVCLLLASVAWDVYVNNGDISTTGGSDGLMPRIEMAATGPTSKAGSARHPHDPGRPAGCRVRKKAFPIIIANCLSSDSLFFPGQLLVADGRF